MNGASVFVMCECLCVCAVMSREVISDLLRARRARGAYIMYIHISHTHAVRLHAQLAHPFVVAPAARIYRFNNCRDERRALTRRRRCRRRRRCDVNAPTRERNVRARFPTYRRASSTQHTHKWSGASAESHLRASRIVIYEF